MIVPVKRINLVLLPEEKNAVFLALQKEELFMIKGFNVENHSLFNSDQLVKTKKVIKILEAENKKKKRKVIMQNFFILFLMLNSFKYCLIPIILIIHSEVTFLSVLYVYYFTRLLFWTLYY